jgi:transcriptional regulator with GAF, ATPase, and Fis domain
VLEPDAYLSETDAAKRDDDFETLVGSEYNLILRTLKKVHWRVEGIGGAADLLNVNPSTLRSRMRKLGIVKPRIENVSAGH